MAEKYKALWEKLPGDLRDQFATFDALLKEQGTDFNAYYEATRVDRQAGETAFLQQHPELRHAVAKRQIPEGAPDVGNLLFEATRTPRH